MGFLLEIPENIEALLVDPVCDATTPLNGFFKGDPIKKTTYKEGRECVADTDVVHGILQSDVVFPFANKTLVVATDGLVEVTASGAVTIEALVGLDAVNPLKFTVLTPSASGTTYRQAFRAKSEAVADNDKFIIELDAQMITV